MLAYLRDNGFRTFIVSGGGIDLIRAFAEEKYGIPRDQVIGSSIKGKFGFVGDRAEVTKLAELDSFDDRGAKPENIYLHIGRRPHQRQHDRPGDVSRPTCSGRPD